MLVKLSLFVVLIIINIYLECLFLRNSLFYQREPLALSFSKWLMCVCFFRQTPEVEKARETWENYKKDYQTSYEKMQVKM